MDALRRHLWPGNVRKLRDLISKSLIFSDGPCIGLWDLALAVEPTEGASNSAPNLCLEESERQMVFKALDQTDGHQQKAAKLLGISRRTLSRKLKIYGVSEVWEDSVA